MLIWPPSISPAYLDFNLAFVKKHMHTVRAGPIFHAHFAAVGVKVKLLHASIVAFEARSNEEETHQGLRPPLNGDGDGVGGHGWKSTVLYFQPPECQKLIPGMLTQAVHMANGQQFLRDAIRRMSDRLLDLTLRNRLLDYRFFKRSTLRFVDCVPDNIHRKLLEREKLMLQAVPEPMWVQPNPKPAPEASAETLNWNISFELPQAEANRGDAPDGLPGSALPQLPTKQSIGLPYEPPVNRN